MLSGVSASCSAGSSCRTAQRSGSAWHSSATLSAQYPIILALWSSPISLKEWVRSTSAYAISSRSPASWSMSTAALTDAPVAS